MNNTDLFDAFAEISERHTEKTAYPGTGIVSRRSVSRVSLLRGATVVVLFVCALLAAGLLTASLFGILPDGIGDGTGSGENGGEKTEPEIFTFSEGVYSASEDGSDDYPCVLIFEDRFTVIEFPAVSYQPSGQWERDGNRVILEGKFAGDDFRFSFALTADSTLLYDKNGSKLPALHIDWTDGTVLRLRRELSIREVTETGSGVPEETGENADRAPDYSGLDASKGLDVIVWQMAKGSYSFGLLEHSETGRYWLSSELMSLKGVNAGRMREILAEYGVGPDSVYIIPWENPISSYIPEYFMADADGNRTSMEEYVASVRKMLFD